MNGWMDGKKAFNKQQVNNNCCYFYYFEKSYPNFDDVFLVGNFFFRYLESQWTVERKNNFKIKREMIYLAFHTDRTVSIGGAIE
jgi:hypothetical protein